MNPQIARHQFGHCRRMSGQRQPAANSQPEIGGRSPPLLEHERAHPAQGLAAVREDFLSRLSFFHCVINSGAQFFFFYWTQLI